MVEQPINVNLRLYILLDSKEHFINKHIFSFWVWAGSYIDTQLLSGSLTFVGKQSWDEFS